MSNIAIITARGGSKRIPRKNIKEFCGKPIMVYSIEAAIQSGIFDTVMVSTDDEEIAEIARKAGAEVPFLRSEATSNDFATTADVLHEVLDNYVNRQKKSFDYACCIYPTAPFVTAKKLQDAMNLLMEKGAPTVMPVVAYSFPPQRSVRIAEDGYLEKLDPEGYKQRSQDLEPIYHDVGQFYGFDVKEFKKTGQLIGDKVFPIVVSELEVQDIDNYEDWAMAEMKYQLMVK